MVCAKKIRGLLDRHLHHVADALFVVEHFEGLRIVTAAAAILARHIAARQKTHLELDRALAAACFAPAAFRVEREAARRITTDAGDRQLPEKFANFVEDFDVGRRCRARCFPDGRLIHFVNGLEELGAGDSCLGSARDSRALIGDSPISLSRRERKVGSRRVAATSTRVACAPQTFLYRGQQDRTHQRRFAGTGNSRDDGEPAHGKSRINLLQVVRVRSPNFDPLLDFA